MKGLLKFITCGSVDDGKSTLIGHILYDAKLLYADQEKALELDSKLGSREGAIDYSLLLDGLMAEREQGITIDVAYRYFTTEHRSFIVADTPGHEEYTRNMAVGASFADLAVILVDAQKGVLLQTRRHARICALMGIRYFIFAVNKMDLIGYDRDKFLKIEAQIEALKEELSLEHITVIPVSATEGDNVTKKSEKLPWYEGEPILACLEQIDVSRETKEEGFYLPVQRVCRPNHTFRGFQGQIEAGEIHVGDEITILPGNEKATVKSILTAGKESEAAVMGSPVTIQLDREVDVSRGSVLTKGGDLATAQKFTASLLWMDDAACSVGSDYFVKIGTNLMTGTLAEICYKIDVNTGEHLQADTLRKNEIAVCSILLDDYIPLDEFRRHRTLGELILIDRISNMTSACGVIEKFVRKDEAEKPVFSYGGVKARGDIFEEFYYNMEKSVITKRKPQHPTYTVGDTIPTKSETYGYPECFDIVILRDKTAVKVRENKIEAILPLEEYRYSGVPVVNGRGFAVRVNSQSELEEYLESCGQGDAAKETLNRWLDFGAYRRVIFHADYWEI